MVRKQLKPIFFALLAAIFYAINVPFSKQLLQDVPPTFMASFLYFGAGIGVGILYLFHWKNEKPEERLKKENFPYTIGMILLDIFAPIFLMFGISIGSSANASLLSNFEIVATTLIALLLFKENVSRRLWTAIGFITISSIILSFEGSGSFHFSLGSLFVLLATICWGMENNCTRKISDKSTYQIVTIKGLCCGTGSFIVAFVTGESLPHSKYILLATLLGFIAYGFIYSCPERLRSCKNKCLLFRSTFCWHFSCFHNQWRIIVHRLPYWTILYDYWYNICSIRYSREKSQSSAYAFNYAHT